VARLVVPGLIGIAGFHSRNDVDEARMGAAVFQHFGDHRFLADMAFGDVGEFAGNLGRAFATVAPFGIEKPEFAPILPIETGARKRRVRQPGDRDVVEDVVARETFGFSLKDA
jgi:hypothetical protein